MSIPEPPPINNGEIVPEQLIKFLIDNCEASTDLASMIQLVKDRDSFGRKKYGQPLMTKDGRNTIEDAKQELGDLVQYLFKAKINGEDIAEIKRLIPFLLAIVN